MNFLKHLVFGALAIIASWALSGCRFGNHVVQAPNPDSISGFYESSPQKLTLCVSTTSTHCLDVAVGLAPAPWSSVMSDPVGLSMKSLPTADAAGLGYLVSKLDTSQGISVGVSNDRSLYRLQNSGPSSWIDNTCTTEYSIESKGSYTPAQNTHTVDGITVRGTLALDAQMTRTFASTCGPAMQMMSDCYNDITHCWGSDSNANTQIQQEIQGLLGPYISSGVMGASDIPALRGLGYQISYQ